MTAAAFKVGDGVRMICVRYRGRRAQLLELQRCAEGKQAEEKQSAQKSKPSG